MEVAIHVLIAINVQIKKQEREMQSPQTSHYQKQKFAIDAINGYQYQNLALKVQEEFTPVAGGVVP